MLCAPPNNQWTKDNQELISYKAIFADLEEILSEYGNDLLLGKAFPKQENLHLFPNGLFCAVICDSSGSFIPEELEAYSYGDTLKTALVRAIEKFKGE